MRFFAYAKLNLALGVTGLRDDGYHLLDSIFCQIDLGDELSMEKGSDGRFSFACSDASLVTEDNLVLKAVRLFSQKTGLSPSLHIRLHKRIPIQAGLGGGSTDAAAALKMLCGLYPQAMDDEALTEMAKSLGADVPFALYGGMQRAQGVGEMLTPIALDKTLHFVILKPHQGLSTPAVFRAYDASPNAAQPDIDGAIAALQKGDLKSFSKRANNALQPSAQVLCPEIQPLCDALRTEGAPYACMTGTGSAVFGLFETESAAKVAAKALEGIAPFCVYAHSI